MLNDLENDLKKILLAGVGAVALTAEKSEALVRELVRKGELTVEQGKTLNEELKHKVKEAAADVKAAVTSMPDVGRMTTEERAELRRRLDELDAKEPDGGAQTGD